MSIYNDLFGFYPAADELLAVLGIDRSTIPRYRDCYLWRDSNRIVILTRTGGIYFDKWRERCEALRNTRGFLCAGSQPGNSSYVLFFYQVPAEYKVRALRLLRLYSARDPSGLWRQLIAKVTAPGAEKDPDVLELLRKMRPTVDKIRAAAGGSAWSQIDEDA